MAAKQKNMDKSDANKGYQSASGKAPGGQPAPRIGGKYAKGDSRSKTMTGAIKPSKGC